MLLEPTRATDRDADPRTSSGSCGRAARRTSKHGLRLGYELARSSMTENGIDRVVLASDGVANVGLTDPEGILGSIRRDAAAGIELVSVGVGMGNYNDVLLEQLADQGDGFYAYVNGPDEADRLFTEDLTGTLQTVALDARAQVEFDPDAVAAYRLVGYENRDIADRDFTDDSVDAGAIGAGHSVTALYAVRLHDDVGRQGRIATVRLRWTDPDDGRVDEVAREIRDERSRPLVPGDATPSSASTPSWRRRPRCCAAARGPATSRWATWPRSPSARPRASRRPTRSMASWICSTAWPVWTGRALAESLRG